MLDQVSNTSVDSLVDFVSAVALVVGIWFAVIQLRQANIRRRDHAAVDIVRTVQTQEVRRAVRLVFTLPEQADPALINENKEILDAALAVDSACEMWGSMVFEGVVDHKLLDRMVGGWIRGTWARLHLWVEQERVVTGNDNVGEWWQWIFELLEADPDTGKQLGAHIAYRGVRRKK